MADPMTNTPGWSFDDRVARRGCDGMAARLDLDDPATGLTLAPAEGGRFDHVLGLELRSPCHLTDHWLRGDDVVAMYEPEDARRLRATAMWRPNGTGHGTGWELTVSAQTSLVRSDSALAVVSAVECDELRRCGPPAPDRHSQWTVVRADEPLPDDTTCLLLRRQPHGGRPATSVLIAVHPADAGRIVVHVRSGRARIECWLFSSTIEKGVLMRSRVLAAFGPAAEDEDWAGRLAADFAASPTPLTA